MRPTVRRSRHWVGAATSSMPGTISDASDHPWGRCWSSMRGSTPWRTCTTPSCRDSSIRWPIATGCGPSPSTPMRRRTPTPGCGACATGSSAAISGPTPTRAWPAPGRPVTSCSAQAASRWFPTRSTWRPTVSMSRSVPRCAPGWGWGRRPSSAMWDGSVSRRTTGSSLMCAPSCSVRAPRPVSCSSATARYGRASRPWWPSAA